MIHLREQFWAYPLPVTAEGAEIRGEHPGRTASTAFLLWRGGSSTITTRHMEDSLH
jgi:hypothetical protein